MKLKEIADSAVEWFDTNCMIWKGVNAIPAAKFVEMVRNGANTGDMVIHAGRSDVALDFVLPIKIKSLWGIKLFRCTMSDLSSFPTKLEHLDMEWCKVSADAGLAEYAKTGRLKSVSTEDMRLSMDDVVDMLFSLHEFSYDLESGDGNSSVQVAGIGDRKWVRIEKDGDDDSETHRVSDPFETQATLIDNLSDGNWFLE